MATGTAWMGELARGSVLGTIAVTAAGVVAGAVGGSIGTPVINEGLHSVFGAEHWDDGGEILGGGLIGGLAGGIGALSGALGAGPGSVAVWAAGGSAGLSGLLFAADHFSK